MSDLITVRGFVATNPDTKALPNGTPVTNFRIASTPRWFDNATQSWKENGTNWYTVNAYRTLAHNIHHSVKVGQPVIINGRLRIKQWQKEDGRTGQAIEIDALSLGHDLCLGTASFSRNVEQSTGQTETQEPERTSPQQTQNATQTTPTQTHQPQPAQQQQNQPQHNQVQSSQGSQNYFDQNQYADQGLTQMSPQDQQAAQAVTT